MRLLVDVDKGGQIKVKSGTKLDFETRTTYMVTLTATDSFGDSASIDVTIMVTDVDEAPDITVGGLAITGMSKNNGLRRERDRHGGNVHGLRAGCVHGYLVAWWRRRRGLR